MKMRFLGFFPLFVPTDLKYLPYFWRRPDDQYISAVGCQRPVFYAHVL